MSMTGIALIVAAFVILLLIIGGGIIFFVVRKGKAKSGALTPPADAIPFGLPASGAPGSQPWSQPPVAESQPQSWGAAEAVSAPPSEPPVAMVEPPAPEPPAWSPEPQASPAPEPYDPFPPVQPGIVSSKPAAAGDQLAATLGPESYTTTPNVSSIPISTVDPFETTPNVPVGHATGLVPATLRAHDGSVIQLVRVTMRVGRHPECEIVIPTPGTSRNHAEFQCVNGAWLVNDLNSGNGTFVNGVRVRTHQLASGDEVRVDQTKFWFTLGG